MIEFKEIMNVMKKQPKKLPKFMLGLKQFVEKSSEIGDSLKTQTDSYSNNTMNTSCQEWSEWEYSNNTANMSCYTMRPSNPLRKHRRLLTYSDNFVTPKCIKSPVSQYKVTKTKNLNQIVPIDLDFDSEETCEFTPTESEESNRSWFGSVYKIRRQSTMTAGTKTVDFWHLSFKLKKRSSNILPFIKQQQTYDNNQKAESLKSLNSIIESCKAHIKSLESKLSEENAIGSNLQLQLIHLTDLLLNYE